MTEIGKTSWTLTIYTERLVLRPQRKSDYESWYVGFVGRLPKQHQYDTRKLDMEGCDLAWFLDLRARHQEVDDKQLN